MNFITPLTDGNIKYYLPLLPRHIIEEAIVDDKVLMFGIEHDKTAVGTIALKTCASEVELIWYFVAEQYRGLGIGTTMFDELIVRLREKGYRDMRVKLSPRADKGLISLLSAYPFTYEETDDGNLYTTVGKLKDVKTLMGDCKKSIALSKLSHNKLNKLCNSIIDRDSALVPMPIHPSDYLADISSVYIEGEDAHGIFLVKQEEKNIRVAFIYSESTNPLSLVDMMRYSVKEAAKAYDENTDIEINVINDELADFAEKLLSSAVSKRQQGQLSFSCLDKVFEEVDDLLMTFEGIETV